MIFVAQPYYHTNKNIIENRVKAGAAYCGALLKQNIMCISPVMYGSTILNYIELPADFSFWNKISFSLLERCDEMHVLQLIGWKHSRGVSEEIKMATEKKIPIKYLPMDEVYGVIYKSNIQKKYDDEIF